MLPIFIVLWLLLEWLSNEGMIQLQCNSKGTCISIKNWTLYQKDLLKGNTKETPKKQSLDTNKECINNENELENRGILLSKSVHSKLPHEDDRTEFRFADKPDTEPYHYTELFIRLMRSNNPKARLPKPNTVRFEKWCVEISKLNRIDNREWSEIQAVMEFSQRSQFWASVVLSTKKLREKFDQLWLQHNQAKQPLVDEVEGELLSRLVNNPNSGLNKFLKGDMEDD